ncbi:hypothetical protein L7F22_034319 [Adiantum nelumboides]|nr:hypothetical protein [Adiantum nelumboides]
MPPSCPRAGDPHVPEEGLQCNRSSEQTLNLSSSSSISQKSSSFINLSASCSKSPEYQQRVGFLNVSEETQEFSEDVEVSASAASSSRLKEESSSWGEEESISSSSSLHGSSMGVGERRHRVLEGEAGESWGSSRRRERPCEEELASGEENEGCYTPRAKDCMIPQVRFCPPAPRKRKPCLRLAFSPCHLSRFLAVPDFDVFFPLHHQQPIPLRE